MTAQRYCRCNHPHIPGSTFCYACDLPIAPPQDQEGGDPMTPSYYGQIRSGAGTPDPR